MSYDDVTDDETRLRDRIEELEQDNRALRATILAAQEVRDSYITQLQAAQEHAKAEAREHVILRDQRTRAEVALQASRELVDIEQDRAIKLACELTAAQEERDGLRGLLDTAENHMREEARLRTEVARLKGENEEVRNRLANLTIKHAQANDRIEELEREKADLGSAIGFDYAEMKAQLQVAQEARREAIDGWKDALEREGEVQVLMAVVASKKAEVERLRGAIRDAYRVCPTRRAHRTRRILSAALTSVGSEEAGGSSGPPTPEGTHDCCGQQCCPDESHYAPEGTQEPYKRLIHPMDEGLLNPQGGNE